MQPHGPCMTCSDSSALPNVHLLQKWITLVTQDKFRNTLLCDAMVTILCFLVHFGAFWCASCATPWPLHDLLWLLYPSKCPFTPEMDHMSHSGQIRNTFLCDGTVTISVYFGPFWCTSWATPWPLFIEFLSSQQKHVSDASRAFKRDQSHLPSLGNAILTWVLSMG